MMWKSTIAQKRSQFFVEFENLFISDFCTIRAGSKHNNGVTDSIVKSVLSEKKYTDPIAISCKQVNHFYFFN